LVYQVPLDKLSIPYETLPVESRDRLDQAIWAVWEGRVGDQERQIASEVVDWLRARNTEMIILGCTEIPLLFGELADRPDLINPAQLLAEAAVRYAMQE
jgi:aspartate/glutamate racemase